jgi:hypothetical protein
MSSPITLYYSANDLITNTSVKYNTEIVGCLGYKQLQNAVIYSDSGLSTSLGVAFFDISILKIPNGANNTVYDTELGYFMFETSSGQTNSIGFTIALYTPDVAGVLPAGSYEFQITNGSGVYLGATGTVSYSIDPNGLRTVTITYTIP